MCSDEAARDRQRAGEKVEEMQRPMRACWDPCTNHYRAEMLPCRGLFSKSATHLLQHCYGGATVLCRLVGTLIVTRNQGETVHVTVTISPSDTFFHFPYRVRPVNQ
jgi:hypothetical protein